MTTDVGFTLPVVRVAASTQHGDSAVQVMVPWLAVTRVSTVFGITCVVPLKADNVRTAAAVELFATKAKPRAPPAATQVMVGTVSVSGVTHTLFTTIWFAAHVEALFTHTLFCKD
jgi:hypothetical protein